MLPTCSLDNDDNNDDNDDDDNEELYDDDDDDKAENGKIMLMLSPIMESINAKVILVQTL